VDGSFRHRNNMSHSINVVASAKLPDRDHRGLKDTVIDMVTLGRHIGADAPLLPVCQFARREGGFCHVHGFARDWARRTRPGNDASAEEKERAQRLRSANCFSSANVRCPLSAPAAEALGVQLAARFVFPSRRVLF